MTAPERPVRAFQSRGYSLPVADDVAPTSRTTSDKEDSASLYGRIDV